MAPSSPTPSLSVVKSLMVSPQICTYSHKSICDDPCGFVDFTSTCGGLIFQKKRSRLFIEGSGNATFSGYPKSLIIGLCLPIFRAIPVFNRIPIYFLAILMKCGKRESGVGISISAGPLNIWPSSAFHLLGGRITLRDFVPFSITGATSRSLPIMN